MSDGALCLREVTPADAERLFRWRQEPRAREMFRHRDEIPFSSHLAFVERYFGADNHDRWYVVEVGGDPIGAIALYDFSVDGAAAEWGRFVLDPVQRGRGLGRRALELLCAHARELGVRSLRCEVLAENERALGLYRAVGFSPVGEQVVDGRRFVQLARDLGGAPS